MEVNDTSPLMVWQTKTGKVLYRFMGENGGVTAIAMHPNGKEMASGNYHPNYDYTFGSSIKIWDLEKGILRQTLRPGLPDEQHQIYEGEFRIHSPRESSIRTLLYSREGRSLLSGSYGFTPWLWNLKTGKIEKVFRHKGCKP